MEHWEHTIRIVYFFSSWFFHCLSSASQFSVFASRAPIHATRLLLFLLLFWFQFRGYSQRKAVSLFSLLINLSFASLCIIENNWKVARRCFMTLITNKVCYICGIWLCSHQSPFHLYFYFLFICFHRNNVLFFVWSQIPATTLRILLNHFKWDKEKLMEKYYDGDQEAFFRDAHVINPFNKPQPITRPKLKRSGTEECEICYSNFPPSVSILDSNNNSLYEINE